MDVRKIACPDCGKVYAVPVWSKQPRCRVCGALLPMEEVREQARAEAKRPEDERRAA